MRWNKKGAWGPNGEQRRERNNVVIPQGKAVEGKPGEDEQEMSSGGGLRSLEMEIEMEASVEVKV